MLQDIANVDISECRLNAINLLVRVTWLFPLLLEIHFMASAAAPALDLIDLQ
jgi:hypothetical protein